VKDFKEKWGDYKKTVRTRGRTQVTQLFIENFIQPQLFLPESFAVQPS